MQIKSTRISIELQRSCLKNKMEVYRLKELKIEVTYRCPLACVHCSSNAGSESDVTISLQKCSEIIKDAAKLGVKEIAFSGGEPLVWPHISNAVQLCSDCGIRPTIYTSGNCDDIDESFHNLHDAGLKRAVFSVYSPNEQEHIRITRRCDSFQNTLHAISVCVELGITPEIHFVAMASNYLVLPDVVELAKKLGVGCVSVLRFVPQGRGLMIRNHDTLSYEQNKDLIKIINNIRAAGFNIRTGSPFNVLLLNKDPHCMAAKDRLIIAPDLSVYPCDAFKQIKASQIVSDTSFSSLESVPLEKCWNSSTYLNTVRNAIDQPPKGRCKSCRMYDSCKSGCLAQRFIAYGSLDPQPDPSCLNRGFDI